MTTARDLPLGHALFVRYAYPPNELGYCGPGDTGALLAGRTAEEITASAREFEGTWPYLRAIADAAGITDPLDADVVRSYWVGGPLLDRVEAAVLLAMLRTAFAGQHTGMLSDLDPSARPLAHHSFHVFAVYPWIRFLTRHPDTALRVLQNCRIRWGTVESVRDDTVMVSSSALVYRDGMLSLAPPTTEQIRWRDNDLSLTTPPSVGTVVAAHWNWVCDTLSEADTAALADATESTLALVNAARKRLSAGLINNSTPPRGQVKEVLMNTPGEHLSEEPQEARGAPGSRDTGSDQPSGGPTERPSGTYEGDETVPSHGAHGRPEATGAEKTEQPPTGTEPPTPPYEGRQSTAKPSGQQTESEGARTGGAVKPTTEERT